MKVSNIFKVLTIALLVVALTISAISCKGAIVEEQKQEEEKPVAEVSSETAEKEKEVIQEEVPPAIEEKPQGPVEWEGVTINPIEGLRFDKGTFFALKENPYGLENGEKAGVFVKDAVEINGIMESFFGLRPEVIEVIQKERMEKGKSDF